ANVARVQPSLLVDRPRGGLAVVQVAPHDLRTADPQLAVLVRAKVLAGPPVDHPAFGVRQERSDGAGPLLGRVVVGGAVGAGSGLGEPVAMDDLTTEELRGA